MSKRQTGIDLSVIMGAAVGAMYRFGIEPDEIRSQLEISLGLLASLDAVKPDGETTDGQLR